MNIWGKILFKGRSELNGEVKVVEFFGGNRRLFAGNFAQSRSLKEDGRSEFYWDAFVDSVGNLPESSSILILGLAAGTSASSIRKIHPNVEIDGVEIDPLMIELGNKFFGLKEARVNIIIDDATAFVAETKKKYGLIFVDLFVGGQVPSFVFKKDYIEKLKTLMKPRSRIVFNKILENPKEGEELKRLIAQYFKIIGEEHTPGKIFPGNMILVGQS